MDFNFDAMDQSDLWSFWWEHSRPSRKKAAAMFPAKPAGFMRAYSDIANYACNKSVAMGCRARGDIQGARLYENICEDIYSRLPDFARW